MPKFKPIPEKLFFRRIVTAVFLLFILILIGTAILYPKTNDFKKAIAVSASEITRVPLGGENAVIFFILALFGYVLAFYIIYVSIEFALEGKFKDVYLHSRMEKKIKNLKNHCIVCGYGRVGKNVVNKLVESGKHVVVLEKNEELVKELREEGFLCESGTVEEDDLKKVGIEKAKYFIACTGNDGTNILLIMAARELNPNITIISRANNEKIIRKMKFAGADYVVMPELLGGVEMVEAILKTDKRNSSKGKYYKSH